jgi:hypothetical protein
VFETVICLLHCHTYMRHMTETGGKCYRVYIADR